VAYYPRDFAGNGSNYVVGHTTYLLRHPGATVTRLYSYGGHTQIILAVGATYAAVPLYRMFCAATGFAGTPVVGKGHTTYLLRPGATVTWLYSYGTWNISKIYGTNALASP
jgi:hypothetical protein